MRVLSHLLLPPTALHRRFPSHALTAIEEAVPDGIAACDREAEVTDPALDDAATRILAE